MPGGAARSRFTFRLPAAPSGGQFGHGVEGASPGSRTNSSTLAAAHRSSWASLTRPAWSPDTVSRDTSARMDLRASDLARRTRRSTSATASSTAGSPRSASGRSRGDGQAARCTDPSRHHDQTSSVTNGRNGANSRSSTPSAARRAATADASPAYARALTSST